MATESPGNLRLSTMNVKSAQYRTITMHLEKGSPPAGKCQGCCASGMGRKPHMKANGVGKEFSSGAEPAHHNDLAHNIQLVETAWFVKTAEQASAAPPITRYLYLTNEQHWRGPASDKHTRNQPVRAPPPYSGVGISDAGPF